MSKEIVNIDIQDIKQMVNETVCHITEAFDNGDKRTLYKQGYEIWYSYSEKDFYNANVDENCPIFLSSSLEYAKAHAKSGIYQVVLRYDYMKKITAEEFWAKYNGEQYDLANPILFSKNYTAMKPFVSARKKAISDDKYDAVVFDDMGVENMLLLSMRRVFYVETLRRFEMADKKQYKIVPEKLDEYRTRYEVVPIDDYINFKILGSATVSKCESLPDLLTLLDGKFAAKDVQRHINPEKPVYVLIDIDVNVWHREKGIASFLMDYILQNINGNILVFFNNFGILGNNLREPMSLDEKIRFFEKRGFFEIGQYNKTIVLLKK